MKGAMRSLPVLPIVGAIILLTSLALSFYYPKGLGPAVTTYRGIPLEEPQECLYEPTPEPPWPFAFLEWLGALSMLAVLVAYSIVLWRPPKDRRECRQAD